MKSIQINRDPFKITINKIKNTSKAVIRWDRITIEVERSKKRKTSIVIDVESTDGIVESWDGATYQDRKKISNIPIEMYWRLERELNSLIKLQPKA